MAMEVFLEQDEIREAAFEHDPRWLLVQRIQASGGFRRAGQLRKILLYVSKVAILQPGQILREYDIACDVLERRPNFNPQTTTLCVRNLLTCDANLSTTSAMKAEMNLYF